MNVGKRGTSGEAMETSTRTSIGTILLLIAAVIVLLTFVFRGPLWQSHLGSKQQLRETVAASKEISASPIAASALPLVAASPANATTGRRHEVADSPASIGNKQQTQRGAATPSTSELEPRPLRTFNEDDPWAATRCVYVYNPGSDTNRWKIENGCEVPVGIVLANRSLILPAPAQRPVTLDEQTLDADSVRYTACFVATPKARTLIGAPSEERSTAAWREQLASARMSDGCLSRIR